MKLIKSTVKNFRLLSNVKITFNQNTTSIVGKNNTGKTSLSSVFRLFLNERNDLFHFEDFSLMSHKRFISAFKYYKKINDKAKETRLKRLQKIIPKIQLILTIEYDEKDNWVNIKPFFIDLSESNRLEILCEYAPKSTELFLKDLTEIMHGITYSDEELISKIKSLYNNYYKIFVRPFSETEQTDNANRSDLTNLLQTKFINAQRVLDDSDRESKSKLSRIFQNQFQYENSKDISQSKELIDVIDTASRKIDIELSKFFSSFIIHFETFGFPGMSTEKVELTSDLQPDTIFKNNIKLFYNHNGNKLPERYNGLGYSNLIYIISQIVGFSIESKDIDNNLKLIFIEEPEAHMHPQMQSVFIKNIENFLITIGLKVQIIITTHSSHILSDSPLECIRYFTKDYIKNIAIVKDLMDFNDNLSEKNTKKFLQQYLTLGKCDLFFADKVILFEGTVERILLPLFIKKIENTEQDCQLSQQYISSVEIGGSYMSKFKELLEFLNLKTLIITDIDSINKDTREKTEVKKGEGLITSNVTLKNWIPQKETIEELLESNVDKFYKNESIGIAYQNNTESTNELYKCGRSFEEAFIIDNCEYIYSNKANLLSIKHILSDCNNTEDVKNKSYDIQDYIDRNKKKTEFAFDLFLIDNEKWTVPTYIKEGLVWLAK